jgi:YihY family inner membrane protein
MSRLGDAYRAFDRYQQRHSLLGFPFAVQQKFGDDQGGYLAATLSYYAFFSLFPLLLVATTVLGFVLEGHPSLRNDIIDTALAQFPVIGDQLRVNALTGNGIALAAGVVIALWSGTSVFLAAENAMNHVWGVPFRKRPDPFKARGKALLLVLALGSAALCATALSFIGTFGSSYHVLWKAGSVSLSTLLAFGIFWLAFRTLTIAEVGWKDTWLGALVASILYQLLQALGSFYVEHVVQRASALYGTFALVIGLLSWIYLGATLTLYAAEVNVVAFRRLWPRSFSSVFELPATGADERALTQRAEIEERRSDERIAVRWQVEEAHHENASSRGDDAPTS